LTKYTFGFRNPESLTELNFTPEEENELLQLLYLAHAADHTVLL
jgi:hypothetical protein